MGQYNIVYEHRSRSRWAAFGFLMIVALSIIAWFAAPAVIDWIRKVTHGAFPPANLFLTKIQLQIVFTLIVFLLLAIVTALIVTLAAPRRPLNVKEKDLIKEREANAKYQRMQRKRQRRINRDLREQIEKNQK